MHACWNAVLWKLTYRCRTIVMLLLYSMHFVVQTAAGFWCTRQTSEGCFVSANKNASELCTFAVYHSQSFWATVRPMLWDRCLSVCPVCIIGVFWPNGSMDQDETWYEGRRRPGWHCVSWDPAPPPQKGGTAAPPFFAFAFGLYLLWQNGLMDQVATWCGGRPWPRPHCRWGPSPAP